MKGKLGLIAILLISVLAISNVMAISLSDFSVEINGRELSDTSSSEIRNILKDNTMDVDVIMTPSSDVKDVVIEGVLRGHDSNVKIEDMTDYFDMKQNVEYQKTLKLKLPANMDADLYRLRLRIDDRASETYEKDYYLNIDTVRNGITVKDVMFSQAIGTLVTNVRVENIGQKDQDNVKVKVSIPKLSDIEPVTYIDTLNANDETTTEDMYMEIPDCVKAGKYDGTVTVEYKDGEETTTKDFVVDIKSANCDVKSDKVILGANKESAEITAGESVAFPITVTNTGDKKTVTITSDVNDWADVEFTPSNVIVLDKDDSQLVYAYVTAKTGASAGDHLLNIKVEADGKALSTKTIKATVTKKGFDLTTGLTYALIVLVGLLVIIGLIVGFNRLKGDDDFDEDMGQTYY